MKTFPLGGISELLFFYYYCTCILNPVFPNPFPKRNPSFFVLDPYDCIVSQNPQYIKTSPLFSIEKKKCGFSVTKAKIQDKLEPLTIGCEFMNDFWI